MECGQESIEASLHIVWMHGLDPSCADFLFHGSASEVEPRFVEIVAKGIRSSHPIKDGRCIAIIWNRPRSQVVVLQRAFVP